MKIRWYLSLFLVCIVATVRADIIINEICPSNLRYIDRGWNYGGWVELYNTDDYPLDLYGYYLSDDGDKLRKFRITQHVTIPAKGYVVFYGGGTATDTLQMKFDLDCDGGRIYLADRIGREISHVDYPEAMSDISYARTTDGGDEWAYCAFPTHAASNNGGQYATERCPEPEFSHVGGMYLEGSDELTLRVSCAQGMKVLYTTDCTLPTQESDEWNGRLKLNKTTVVRAMTVADGYLPSRVVTHSYIFEDHLPTLPVVSVVTDKNNLWSLEYGIYTSGTNGVPGNGSDSPRNWNRDWTRPANLEYIVDGSSALSQPCNIAIAGGWSRGSSQKSLKVTAKKKYDMMNYFEYPFFPAKPGLKYKSILLRNGGNDWSNSMMKDALLQMTVAEVMDIEYQSYQPTVQYLNGQYYGIINLRERNNTQYVYSNFGWDEEEIDMIEKVPYGDFIDTGCTYQIKAGDTEAIDYVVELAAQLPDKDTYNELKELVDIDALVTYLMPELWTGNWDWPQNNIKLFRHRDGGKFRWVLYDLENGFGDLSFNHFTDSEFGFNGYKTSDGHTTKLIQGLLKQPEFQALLIDQMSVCLGSVFLPERFDALADSIYTLIAGELPYNVDRWGTTRNAAGYVEDFKNFNRQRPAYVRDDFRDQFSLGADVPLVVRSNHSSATLTLNGLPLPLGYMDGHTYQGRELTLSASSPAGYRFVGWSTVAGKEYSILPHGAVWSYYDQGSLEGSEWMSVYYDDDDWEQGAAPLGYSNDEIATVVSYGDNANDKHPTTYFRTSFMLNDYNPVGTYRLNLHVDDGAVVYINGYEVCRYLLPSGYIGYYDYASTYASGNPDKVGFDIPASVLKQGKNTIAVEIHQHSGTSSDIYMDLAVNVVLPEDGKLVEDNPYTFVAESSVEMMAYFEPEKESAAAIPPVRINEVCLSNATYVNEYFKRNDWIELHNTTDEPQSIAGLYITKDIDNPQYYQIPDEGELSVIPPRGYRILWADKLMSFSELHLPFKLSADGEFLMLSSYDEAGNQLWADSMHVGYIGENVSYGRYPNGSDNLYVMNRMTFGDANFYSSYNLYQKFTADDVAVNPLEDTAADKIQIYFNSLTQTLSVQMPMSYQLPENLLIYDMQGRPLLQHSITSDTDAVFVGHLPSGVYIVQVADYALKVKL